MKVAILGVGGMGTHHFNIYKDMKDIEFVAACDVRIEHLSKLAEGMNINLYTDISEMLKTERPDMVDICTPTYLHAEHSIMAMESGAHVICEKPMAISSADARKIIDVSNKTGKIFMVAHVLRFMSAYKYLESVIRSNKLGRPLKLCMSRISGTPLWSYEGWMLDRTKSGHVSLDMMIHDIDFMRNIFGEPEDIHGVRYEMRDLTNYLSAVYEYDGFSVTIDSGWFKSNPPFISEYLALFENGYVEFKNGIVTNTGEVVDLNRADIIEQTGINLSNVDGYAEEIYYFINCIKNGTRPELVTMQSSHDSVSLVEKTVEKLTVI